MSAGIIVAITMRATAHTPVTLQVIAITRTGIGTMAAITDGIMGTITARAGTLPANTTAMAVSACAVPCASWRTSSS